MSYSARAFLHSLAGGIIIFLISLDMILGKSKSGDKDIPDDPGQNPADIAVGSACSAFACRTGSHQRNDPLRQ